MLLGEYDSSDDEAPVPGPSVPRAASPESDNEDDAAIAEQAKKDAFGLTAAEPVKTAAVSTKVAVSAAPDVLKEDPNIMSNAIITRPTDQVS